VKGRHLSKKLFLVEELRTVLSGNDMNFFVKPTDSLSNSNTSYRIRLVKISPPDQENKGVRAFGAANFLDSKIVVSVPDKREGTWCVLVVLSTLFVALVVFSCRWPEARKIAGLSFVFWAVLFQFFHPLRRRFKVDLADKENIFLYEKREVLCLRLKKDRWIGVKGVGEDSERFIEDFLKTCGPIDSIDE